MMKNISSPWILIILVLIVILWWLIFQPIRYKVISSNTTYSEYTVDFIQDEKSKICFGVFAHSTTYIPCNEIPHELITIVNKEYKRRR